MKNKKTYPLTYRRNIFLFWVGWAWITLKFLTMIPGSQSLVFQINKGLRTIDSSRFIFEKHLSWLRFDVDQILIIKKIWFRIWQKNRPVCTFNSWIILTVKIVYLHLAENAHNNIRDGRLFCPISAKWVDFE